jgi:hypothetical protein
VASEQRAEERRRIYPLTTDDGSYQGETMKWMRTTVRNVQTAGELFGFFGRQKRWWVLPIIVTLFLLGALIVVAQSSSLAPFIYTMF